MPFDAATYDDKTALYMERRQRAWDEVWSKVPEQSFDMGDWRCGTSACALGWLGERNFDGWTFGKNECAPQHKAYKGRATYAAQAYFGLSEYDACATFWCGNAEKFYAARDSADVTAADVHRVLMSLPVTVPA